MTTPPWGTGSFLTWLSRAGQSEVDEMTPADWRQGAAQVDVAVRMAEHADDPIGMLKVLLEDQPVKHSKQRKIRRGRN